MSAYPSITMKFPIRFLCFIGLLLSTLNRGECQTKKLTEFSRDIAPILQSKCASCHEGEKARNGFVVSDRDALLAFVEPGNSKDSSLWTDYLDQPPKTELADSLVMPPDGPLKVAELATLKLWIDEGADWPEGTSISQREKPATEKVPAEAAFMGTKIYRAIGYFHPAIVHFPIALFLVGGVCAFLSYFLGPRCQTTAFQCISIAATASLLTVVMGWSFADTQGYPAWDKMLPNNATHDETNFFMHRWLGTLAAILGMGCVLLGLLARRYKSNGLGHAWRVGAIAVAALVGMVGHQGGELVYGDIFDKAIEQLKK